MTLSKVTLALFEFVNFATGTFLMSFLITGAYAVFGVQMPEFLSGITDGLFIVGSAAGSISIIGLVGCSLAWSVRRLFTR